MFEREIKFIYDFSLNQIRRLGTSFTIKQLTTCGLHPALHKYIEAEIDFLIYEDRKRFIDKSNFDYTGESILKQFELIAKEIKAEKRLTIDYISQLLLHAISFNINYLAQPKWALSKLIFPNDELLNVVEVKQILNYLYFYPHIKQITEKYFTKKQLIVISKQEFEELIAKVQNEIFSLYNKSVFEKVLLSMAEFYNIGSSVKTKVPLTAVELFIKENRLQEFINRYEDAFGSELKLNIEINELQGILFSVVPVKRKHYMDRIVKKEQPDSMFSTPEEKIEPEAAADKLQETKEEIPQEKEIQSEILQKDIEEQAAEQDKPLEEVLTENIQAENLLEELMEETKTDEILNEVDEKLSVDEIIPDEAEIIAKTEIPKENEHETDEEKRVDNIVSELQQTDLNHEFKADLVEQNRIDEVAETETITPEVEVEFNKEEIALTTDETQITSIPEDQKIELTDIILEEPNEVLSDQEPVEVQNPVEQKEPDIEEKPETGKFVSVKEKPSNFEDTFSLMQDDKDDSVIAIDETPEPTAVEDNEIKQEPALEQSLAEEQKIPSDGQISIETSQSKTNNGVFEEISFDTLETPVEDTSTQPQTYNEEEITGKNSVQINEEADIIDDEDILLENVNFFGPVEKQIDLFELDDIKLKSDDNPEQVEHKTEIENAELESKIFVPFNDNPTVELKQQDDNSALEDGEEPDILKDEAHEISALESIEKEIEGLEFETNYLEDDFMIVSEEKSLRDSAGSEPDDSHLPDEEEPDNTPDEENYLEDKNNSEEKISGEVENVASLSNVDEVDTFPHEKLFDEYEKDILKIDEPLVLKDTPDEDNERYVELPGSEIDELSLPHSEEVKDNIFEEELDKELDNLDEESLDLLENNLDDKIDASEIPLVDSVIDDETSYPETEEQWDNVKEEQESKLMQEENSNEFIEKKIKPKAEQSDIADFFKGKDAEKIIVSVFDEDTQDFLQTCEMIIECRNINEALGILEALFKANHVKSTSKEAVLFKKIVQEYMDKR